MSTEVMTPYPDGAASGRFMRGATFDVPPAVRAAPANDELTGQLRTARDRFHIDTVSVYGMETWDAGGGTGEKDRFFAALAALRLRVVVRLEAYDPGTFAFAPPDVDRLLDSYAPLIRYVAAPDHRDRVAYLAITMPVDDPRVQARLGGIDAPQFAAGQAGYATAAVAAVRALAGRDIPVYLGVFYGWDNSYRPPSYRPASADGYFLNSYSYPVAGPAAANAPDAVLINERRLRETMGLFTAQYGSAPVIVEYGFHTAEVHAGTQPDQVAGLVATARAKRRALTATTRFYCTAFPNVRGTMYFGYNIAKVEGDPPALLDFGLIGTRP